MKRVVPGFTPGSFLKEITVMGYLYIVTKKTLLLVTSSFNRFSYDNVGITRPNKNDEGR
jgi:hypothetical protein